LIAVKVLELVGCGKIPFVARSMEKFYPDHTPGLDRRSKMEKVVPKMAQMQVNIEFLF